jgi:putative flippase GtrA
MTIDTQHGAERPPGFWPRVLGAGRGGARRFGSFAVVGVISTGAFVALYALGRTLMGPMAANFAALSLTMLFNFAANRKYTFEATHGPIHVQTVQYLAVYVLGLGASSAVLQASLSLASEPGRLLETAIATGAGGVATVIRFLLLSAWVFRRPPARAGGIP